MAVGDAIATFLWAAAHRHLGHRLRRSRQTQFDAGVIARERVTGLAAGRNRASCFTLAGLSRVAGHFCRRVSRERHDRGKRRDLICHRRWQHPGGGSRRVVGESIRGRQGIL